VIPVPRGPRGGPFNRNEANHRREVLTTSSPCPYCRRRCLAHSGQQWQCKACDRQWTGHKAPVVTDPLASVRAAVARARNVYARGEFARKESR
jgi:ribosomal protein L37AE/L43A